MTAIEFHLLILFTGMIASFIMGGATFRMMAKQEGWEYGWGDVILAFIISLVASWMGFIAFLIVYLIEKWPNTINAKKSQEKFQNGCEQLKYQT